MRRSYTFTIHVKPSSSNSSQGDGVGVDTDGDGIADDFGIDGSDLTAEETVELLEFMELEDIPAEYFENFDPTNPNFFGALLLMKFINKKEFNKDLVPRINSISSVGDVSIVMNRDIIVPKSYPNFNDKVIKVTVKNKVNKYIKGR